MTGEGSDLVSFVASMGGERQLRVEENLGEGYVRLRVAEAERRQVVGLEPGRASVIVGGALILQSAMAYAGLSSTLVSEHDILYGMVLDCDRAGAS